MLHNVVRIYTCAYTRVCSSVLSHAIVDHSREDGMPFVVEERGKENVVPVRLLSREARLYQRRLRDREWARERLATETAEEREARLARRRVQAKSRLAAESGETQLEHLRSYRESRIAAATRERLAFSLRSSIPY